MRISAWLLIVLFPCCGYGDDGPWGHVSGRFLYDGPPPPAKTIRIAKDATAFPAPLKDESLLVHAKTRGVANVVIYLLPENNSKLPVHPDYAKSADATVELVMKNGRFEPHVLLLRTGQTMKQHNKDAVPHIAKIDFFKNIPM